MSKYDDAEQTIQQQWKSPISFNPETREQLHTDIKEQTLFLNKILKNRSDLEMLVKCNVMSLRNKSHPLSLCSIEVPLNIYKPYFFYLATWTPGPSGLGRIRSGWVGAGALLEAGGLINFHVL